MRISDWSSDVCSSDLTGGAGKLLAEDVSMASSPGFLADGKRIQYMAVGGVDNEDGDAPVVAMTTINTDNGSKEVLAVAQAKSGPGRSEEHTSELQSLMRISYAVFCLKKTKKNESTQNQTSY